ncbi:MAG: GyrI-like domain-containing protein [Candidatus Riflebacteria bacterium]|nr:GyrI-like domain-containing protein [Candidatus Riflebacteria bacterium]
MRTEVLLLAALLLLGCDSGAAQALDPPERQSASFALEPVRGFNYLALECTGPYTGYPKALAEFKAELARWKIDPKGPLMTLYWNSPLFVAPAALRWSIAVPVAVGQRGRGRLVVRRFAYPRVAVAVHRGSYLTTYETLNALYSWIGRRGLKTFGGPAIERYADVDDVHVPVGEKTTTIWIPVRERPGAKGLLVSTRVRHEGPGLLPGEASVPRAARPATPGW